MLDLALCDDEAEQLDIVGRLLRGYVQARPELAIRLSVFSSGRDLLAAEEEGARFDICVLDVVMPELSGIELGIELRERGSASAIIYLTISPEYAVDSYAAKALYYLVKPPEPERLYQVLDQAVAAMEKRRTACITVKMRNSLRLVRFDQILYAERADRTIRYHLANGEQLDSVTVRGSFQEEISPLLADPRFLLCGASFVANLFYVIAVDKSSLRLDGGAHVPLSRGSAAQARQRWQDFWLAGPGRTGR